MPVFEINKPIERPSPTIVVENRLPIGKYIFQLVVEDEEGNRSEPDKATIVVSRRRRPPR